jgi:hypothetical protein
MSTCVLVGTFYFGFRPEQGLKYIILPQDNSCRKPANKKSSPQ